MPQDAREVMKGLIMNRKVDIGKVEVSHLKMGYPPVTLAEAAKRLGEWRERNPGITSMWADDIISRRYKPVKRSWRSRRLGWVRSAAYWLSERFEALAEWLEY